MASSNIGKVESGSGKSYEVWWDSASKDAYVKYTGTLMPLSEGAKTRIGTASSAGEAMTKAEASLYNK